MVGINPPTTTSCWDDSQCLVVFHVFVQHAENMKVHVHHHHPPRYQRWWHEGSIVSCFDERGKGLPESFAMEMSARERLKNTSKWNKAKAVSFNVWLWFPQIYVWIYGFSLPWSVPWPIGSERGWTHIHRLIVIVPVKLVIQFCRMFKQMR